MQRLSLLLLSSIILVCSCVRSFFLSVYYPPSSTFISLSCFFLFAFLQHKRRPHEVTTNTISAWSKDCQRLLETEFSYTERMTVSVQPKFYYALYFLSGCLTKDQRDQRCEHMNVCMCCERRNRPKVREYECVCVLRQTKRTKSVGI